MKPNAEPKLPSSPKEELAEAFQAWADQHGAIWWATDERLAEAIARVLEIDLVWADGVKGVK